MNSLLTDIRNAVTQAFTDCGYNPSFIEVKTSDRPDLSHFQCNTALMHAKEARKNPREIAENVAKKLRDTGLFASVSVDGPGFINFIVAESALVQKLEAAASDSRMGIPLSENPTRITIDYCGPNIAKPMHVGHIRSTIIGDCLKRVYRLLGHTVTADIHLGDWGLQMGMLIVQFQDEHPNGAGFSLSLEELEDLYRRASAHSKEDETVLDRMRKATVDLQNGKPECRALWKKFHDLSLADVKDNLSYLAVEFDLWNGESDYNDIAKELIEKWKKAGFAQESEGALIISLEDVNLPPILLYKKDGAILYHTSDLAALYDRLVNLKQDRVIYVVDKRQELHFRQVFTAAEKLGFYKPGQAEHVGFGTVNGKDGKPFKTREGGVVRLKGLILDAISEAERRIDEIQHHDDLQTDEKKIIARMVGVAAVKFADLINNRESDYIFDLDKFLKFEGKTGPYILYSAVRIKSILRKAVERNYAAGPIKTVNSKLETDLFLKLSGFPEALEKTTELNSPNQLCEYVYELATAFNQYYGQYSVLNEPDAELRASRITLCKFCLAIIEKVAELVGIEIPERM